MSMVEETTTPPAKRKPAKRRKRRPAAVARKPAAECAGLTIDDCAAACYAAAAAGRPGCVLSGKFYCAHPAKGGLQGVDMHNAAAVARVEAAKKMLGKAKIKLPKL